MQIADLFGAHTIRTTRSHAKFALIGNDDWHVVITSSMNLNLNPRIEQFEMTDDPERHQFFTTWVDEVFAEIPAGPARRGDDRTMPETHSLTGVTPVTGATVGTITIGKINE